MKSIVKTLFIGGVLFFGSNAIWAGDHRCTCYHADSDDVGQCKAFTTCDVVYIDVYKQAGPDHTPWLTPATDDQDYFLKAAKLATEHKNKLGVIVNWNTHDRQSSPPFNLFSLVNKALSSEEKLIQKGDKNYSAKPNFSFKYSFIDLELKDQSQCPNLPTGKIAMPGTTNMQVAMGNGTCQNKWHTAPENITIMCYDGQNCSSDANKLLESQHARQMCKEVGSCTASSQSIPDTFYK